MNKTAAVVVTYNRKELLMSCIGCLLRQTVPCDILVIDNASTDGTKEALAELIKGGKIIYRNTGKNLGGAGGFSEGVRTGTLLGYEYLWLLDDDAMMHEDALEKLLHADEKLYGNYGFLSGAVYFRESEELCRMNIQRTSWHEKVSDYSSMLVPIVMATFVSFFVKAEVVRKVGLPISEFFIWADDLEYSRRISLQYSCYMVPESRVRHMMTKNDRVGIESETEDRMWRYRCLYRNECFLYRREGLKGRLYMFLRVLLHSERILLHAKEGKKNKLKTVWQSYLEGGRFRPEIKYIEEKTECEAK